MELTQGKIDRPQCVVIYGPEKIGKSTLASQFPNPVFIDKEDGTAHLDVVRAPVPSSWTMYLDLLREFTQNHHGRQTLVIDSADAIENLCRAQVCSELNVSELGGQNDFGNTYNKHSQMWGKSLDELRRVANSGMHVVMVAHGQMRKFEQPHENGAYDRWELKLEKKVCASTKEWADAIFFVNYKTYVVDDDKTGKKKAKGGQRVIYTSHRPWWDAGNRFGLSDELELKWESIASCFPPPNQAMGTQPAPQPLASATPTPTPEPEPVSMPQPAPQTATTPQPLAQSPVAPPADFLGPLFDLMKRDQVTEHEVQLAVAKRGYYPQDTPMENYDPQFVSGKLVAYWDVVRRTIDEVRKELTS